MNPFDVLMKEMNKSGISCEITKKNQHGILEPVRQEELNTISTKSQIATTAHLVSRLKEEEKLEWALETKNEGNELYQQSEYLQAMQKYVECLTASNFGTSVPGTDAKESTTVSTNSNIDELILPVLCNLSACCIQLKQWQKCILFAEQALKLRPNAIKALYRQGIAFVNIGEYQTAIKNFQFILKLLKKEKKEKEFERSRSGGAESEEEEYNDSVGKRRHTVSYTTQSTVNSLNDKEMKNLLYHVTKAKHGINKDQERYQQQKEGLRKAFPSSFSSKSPHLTVPEFEEEQANSPVRRTVYQLSVGRIKAFCLYYLNAFLKILLQGFLMILRMLLRFVKIFVKEEKKNKENNKDKKT
jgi:tetratricopeptide (TPR) repeat protein